MVRVVWRVVFGLLVATVIWYSLAPPPNIGEFSHADKAGHFLAYAALGFSGFLGYAGARYRLYVVCGLIAMGAALEMLQGFRPMREPSLADAFANSLGAVFGMGLACFAVSLWRKFAARS